MPALSPSASRTLYTLAFLDGVETLEELTKGIVLSPTGFDVLDTFGWEADQGLQAVAAILLYRWFTLLERLGLVSDFASPKGETPHGV